MMQTIGLCTQNDSFVYSKPYVCDFQINSLTFPDFTRHFFSSLAETVDSCIVVVLNR